MVVNGSGPDSGLLLDLYQLHLAFMNLLPIPALDGGHVVFLVIEMIKGKPLGDKFMERAQMVGFVLLLSLMVFVLGMIFLRLSLGIKVHD